MTTTKDLEQIRRSALDGLPMATTQPPVIEAPENSLIKQIKTTRKLTDEVISAFAIEPYKFGYQWGWIYPAGGGMRWKNASSDRQPKYAWIPSQPENALIYHAPDILQQIQLNHGLLWIVTEADVWTLRAAREFNAVSTFSETIVPDGLGDALLSMGVTRVLLAPVKDVTGAAFAVKIKAALWGTSIKLTCYDLPFDSSAKHGGDLGTAWRVYDQPEPFSFWLMSLPQVEVKDPEPVHISPAPAYTSGFDSLAEIRQTITAALEVYQFGGDGFSLKNIACLFHDDKHPSASLHHEKGLYCHTCGKWYPWKALAGALGIPWEFSTVTLTPTPKAELIGASWEARSKLIAMGLTNFARAFDWLIHTHETGKYFTFKEFAKAVQPVMSEHTTTNTFHHLQGKNLPKKTEGGLIATFFLSYSLQHKESKKHAFNSPHKKTGKNKGRPLARAYVPTEAQINQVLGIVPLTFNTISLDTITDAAQYRAACMASVIYRKPGKYARRQLTEPLGISAPTIAAYCDRTNILRTPTPPKVTELTPDQIQSLPANHWERVTSILQKKLKANKYLQDEHNARHEYTQQGARHAAQMGSRKLYAVEYQASDYRPRKS